MSKRHLIISTVAVAALIAMCEAAAARAPAILSAPNNQAPSCVTPGRLMAYIRDRYANLPSKYDGLASLYQRISTQLGVRWDYAFYQMLVETGFLKYGGDVLPRQNNFAGIGATGNGVRGESFRSIEDGVRAHVEHLLIYADVPVANPVAERTAKVQKWAVYRGWPRKLGRPVSYEDMASKWAPGTRSYWRSIESVAARFMDGRCRQPDPEPQIAAIAPTTRAESGQPPPMPTSRAAVVERKEPAQAAAATQTGSIRPSTKANSQTSSNAEPAKTVAIINRQPDATSSPALGSETASLSETAGERSVGRFASNFIAAPSTAEAGTPTTCRVWQASYGGQRAVIIKSIGGDHVNYTVLDVNSGREDREIAAYVNAYAKGGETVAQYDNQQTALRKAFELCPNAAQEQATR